MLRVGTTGTWRDEKEGWEGKWWLEGRASAGGVGGRYEVGRLTGCSPGAVGGKGARRVALAIGGGGGPYVWRGAVALGSRQQ